MGVYFVSAADPAVPQSGTVQRVKVAGHLAENTVSKVIGMVPQLMVGAWKVEIKTQYTVGGAFLKEPRTIESAFALTVV